MTTGNDYFHALKCCRQQENAYLFNFDLRLAPYSAGYDDYDDGNDDYSGRSARKKCIQQEKLRLAAARRDETTSTLT